MGNQRTSPLELGNLYRSFLKHPFFLSLFSVALFSEETITLDEPPPREHHDNCASQNY